MLKDNLKALRKNKGLSQEELSIKLNVVRQTISKWEQGLSVPDAEMLISISEVFETHVSTILGENIEEKEKSDIKVISEKLEIINLQLSQRKNVIRKMFRWVLISLCVITLITFLFFVLSGSPYLNWDYTIPESSVLGTILHSFEWLFIRIAPLIFVILVIGMI